MYRGFIDRNRSPQHSFWHYFYAFVYTDLFHDDRVEEKKRDDQVLRRRVPFVLFHFLTTPKRGPQTAIALLSHNEHNIHVYNIFIFYCIQYIYILYTYYIYLYTSHRICSSRLAIAETRRNCAASAAVALYIYRLYVHINPILSPMLLFVVSFLKKFSGLRHYNSLLSRDTWTLIFMVSEK